MKRAMPEMAMDRLMMKCTLAAVKLLPLVLCLAGCASTRNAQDWRIGFSFEDDTSCGYYRSLLIFDDGHVDYTISHIPGTAKTLQIGGEEVARLVALVKAFPEELSFFADHEVTTRGGSAEINLLKDEVAKAAHITWENLSSHRPVCPESPRPLPSGRISLSDDR